jgi:glycosyltransferase involved in cell wall biosynthesis
MLKKELHLLYLTAEQWPTFRPDVLALFGKYLPRHGITCDLVTEHESGTANLPQTPWGGGRAILCDVPRNRAAQYVVKFWHDLRVLICMDAKKYDAIQVRDMGLTALAGLIVARLKGVPFYYWLSYPQSEGQIDRAKTRGVKGGMRYWFPLIQGNFGKWLLYKIVLPRADHVFVQSRQMQVDIAQQGIAMSKMTAVPMGVDTELANPKNILPSADPRLKGRRVVAYLGTMDPVRQIEILFQMIALVKQKIPNILLILAGDTEDLAHRAWLKQEIERLGVAEHVLSLGWLPATQAWGYVSTAELGLSPIPRGYLMDMGSPTKAVEYMALGLPVVANDNPDQAQVIADSGAGKCVALHGENFATAVIELLHAPDTMRQMGDHGRAYVAKQRGYDNIARNVAQVYLDHISGSVPMVAK